MLTYEDLQPGRTFGTPEHTVTEEEIIAFGRAYDPQAFHTDPAAARETFFGRLVASGWHTAAVSMSLMVRGDMQLHGGVVGQSIEELRWPRPVLPGDRLRVAMEVVSLEPASGRADRGLIRLRCRTLNQHGKALQEMVARLLIARRIP